MDGQQFSFIQLSSCPHFYFIPRKLHSVLGNGNQVWARISSRNVFLCEWGWGDGLCFLGWNDVQTYIYTYALSISHSFHLFPFVFHVLCILKVGLQDCSFMSRQTSNLLFSLPLCYLYTYGFIMWGRFLMWEYCSQIWDI